MKKILMLILLLINLVAYSQEIILIKIESNIYPIADTLSFKIILNKDNLLLDNEFKRKIESYRKDVDYIWKPEEGLKILIYKK
jgi:hypothetical protein